MCEESVCHINAIDRRSLIRIAGVGLAGAAIGATAINVALAQEDNAPWSYEGESGPDHWGDLDPDNAACSTGEAQSPIDITDATGADLANAVVSYQPVSPMTIVNNGHTIEVTVDPGSTVDIDGLVYELKQFHFHSPSEHAIDGEHHAMELHFVHKTTDDQTAVLAVFLQEGSGGAAFDPVFANLPAEAGPEQTVETTVNPADFLPADMITYRYGGSLTTPPCTEGVQWVLFTTPVEVSTEQVEAFRAVIASNNRPTQPVNDRTVDEDTTP